MKRLLGLILFLASLFPTTVAAQVFTTLYLPTAGSGLTLNVAAGRVFCAGSMATYSGGTLTMTASTTNYVYLNAAGSCAPTAKLTAFALGDIPIATVVAGSSSITTVTDNRTMFQQGGSVSGVSSINGTAGAFTFSGAGVSCSGTTCTFSGSSSSGVQYNPSNTAIVFSGDSMSGDDSGALGSTVTVTSWSISGGVCTFANSGSNGFAAGDWFVANNVTGWPSISSPFAIWTSGYTLFHVSSTGLSSSGWQAACPLLSTASGSGGTVENANYFYPAITSRLPFFNGHGQVSVELPVGSSFSSLSTNFSAVIGAAPTSPAYLILAGGVNDISACGTASTLEGYLTSIWSQAHTNGWTVLQATMIPVNYNTTLCSTAFTTLNAVNDWIRGQGKSSTNASSGQYWDRFVDNFTAVSNQADTNLRQSNGYLGHGGIQLLANLLNTAMGVQGSSTAASFINPNLVTPNIGDATASSITIPDGAGTNTVQLGNTGAFGNSQSIRATMSPALYDSYGYLNYRTDGFWYLVGDFNGGGLYTPVLKSSASAPSGTCASGLGGTWALTQDGAITRCPSGGGTWTTYGNMTATNLASGTLGSVPYQSAASATTFLASPTTSGHTFALAWQPSGSALAPVALDLATYLAAPPSIGGTTPAAGSFSSLKDTGAAAGSGSYCLQIDSSGNITNTGAACGTGGGSGTNVKLNSGSTLTSLGITGHMPEVCNDTSGSGTAQSCSTADTFTPQTGNCLVYSTTTANSGTGLTVNINSLGARNVAVAGSSGWTTTLVASSSIPANKPMNLCYDGTNWDASGTGYAASGSSTNTPLFGIGGFGNNSIGTKLFTFAGGTTANFGGLTSCTFDTTNVATTVSGHVYRIVDYFVGTSSGHNLILAATTGSTSTGYFFGNSNLYYSNGTGQSGFGSVQQVTMVNQAFAQVSEFYLWVIGSSNNLVWGHGFSGTWQGSSDTHSDFTGNTLKVGYCGGTPSNIYVYDLGAVPTS